MLFFHFLRRKRTVTPRPIIPNEELEAAITRATHAACIYVRDVKYQPTDADMEAFAKLEDTLWTTHRVVCWLHWRLDCRKRGEAEAGHLFDDEVMHAWKSCGRRG